MSSENNAIHQALSQNKEWARSVADSDSEFFSKLASGQSPSILWIGCSDSRVPETTITGLKPGDLFVHRNIANQVHANDLNSRCVIEYAVKYLKVQDVVLCGHTGCGGAKGALTDQSLGLSLETWVHSLRKLHEDHRQEFDKLESEDDRITKLVELSVKHGVNTLKQNNHIIDAIKDRGLQVHGLVFDLHKGLLRELGSHDA